MILTSNGQVVALFSLLIFFIILLFLSIVLPSRTIVSVLFIIFFLVIYIMPMFLNLYIFNKIGHIEFVMYPLITLILSFLYLKNKIKVKNKRKLKGLMLIKAILSIILCSSVIYLMQLCIAYPDSFSVYKDQLYLSLSACIISNDIFLLPIGIISLVIISLNKKGKVRYVIKIILSSICLLISLYYFIERLWVFI